jgi:hypothetical protein
MRGDTGRHDRDGVCLVGCFPGRDRDGVRRLAPGPLLERRTDREGRRKAVGLLVGEGAGCGFRLGETAVAVVWPVGTLVSVVFEGDERAGR